MAHAAVGKNAQRYGQMHFIIRSRLFKGLCSGSMNIGSIADDERLKMILPQACCYCGSKDCLAVDHLIPRKKGGADTGDNLVWACRKCNRSKHAVDALEWLHGRQQFPPLLLLRRYLKLAIELCKERNLLETHLGSAPELPIALAAIPTKFPQPSELVFWVPEGSSANLARTPEQ